MPTALDILADGGNASGVGLKATGTLATVSAAQGTGNSQVFVENDQVITASYTITPGKNASSVGPLVFNSGVNVTVPSGARWLIL